MAQKTKSKESKSSKEDIFENPEALVDKISGSEEFFRQNKKLVSGIGIAIGAIVLIIFGGKYYLESQELEAQESMFQAQYYFEQDSLTLALQGDGINPGFLDIVDDYAFTNASDLASFYSGFIYLKQGDFDQAIEYLKKFKAEDAVVQPRAYALIGDALMEKEAYRDAVDWYEKAADYKSNKYFTPGYLLKLGAAYEKVADWSNAASAYSRIVKEFPQAAVKEDAKKLLGRAKALSK